MLYVPTLACWTQLYPRWKILKNTHRRLLPRVPAGCTLPIHIFQISKPARETKGDWNRTEGEKTRRTSLTLSQWGDYTDKQEQLWHRQDMMMVTRIMCVCERVRLGRTHGQDTRVWWQVNHRDWGMDLCGRCECGGRVRHLSQMMAKL